MNGITSIHLNPSRQILTVFSSEEAYDAVSVLVEECSQVLKSSSQHMEQVVHRDQVECCVCYTCIKASGDIFRARILWPCILPRVYLTIG